MRASSLGCIALALSTAVTGACTVREEPSFSQLLGTNVETVSDLAESDTPLDFTKCSLRTGGRGEEAECASVALPLDWERPDERRVELFVKRIRGASDGPHRQLWLLQGGPGGAGDSLEPLAEYLVSNDASLDVYIPDHRGTGRSSRLDCPVERGKLGFRYELCFKELKMRWGGDGLRHFNTTNAARDLGTLIRRTREPGQDVHVYGISYGTYLAQRYLQLFPAQPTAVTLDSVCQAGLCSFLKMGYWFDHVGRKYMRECAADAICGGKLGPDPLAKVKDALAVADAKTCSGFEKLDGHALRKLFGWFIASFELRVLVPATTHRLLRCDDDDVLALRRFERVVTGALKEDDAGGASLLDSDILGMHIAFSELEADPPPSARELGALLTDAVFTEPDVSLREAYDAWPRYERDKWVGGYSTSSVPLLLMNGTLDPQTPLEFAEVVAPHYAHPAQGLVVLPRAAHGVVHQSPTSDAASPACGMTLWQQFIAAPFAPLDTSCKADIRAHDFAGSPALAAHYFSRGTLWGSEPVVTFSGTLPNGGFEAETARVARLTRPWSEPLHRRR